MKKLILKSLFYIFLIIVSLEILVRVFHLYNEDPPRFIDEFKVEKRVPNNTGYAVTGNRNQNFSKFNINSSGFNSYREFTPSKSKTEIAIIGDSFIEGFHQDYDKSTGSKIETKLDDNIEVYEYGYAGYDLSNQLYLTHAYKKEFDLIDHIVIYLDYPTDLTNSEYTPNEQRIALLSSTLFKIRDEFKLLSYASKIGILQPIKELALKIKSGGYDSHSNHKNDAKNTSIKDDLYLNNFKNLVNTYGYNKNKTYLLLDSRITSKSFLEYCSKNGYQYIDFAPAFENSTKPVTLIYDQHWNDHGRELISESIATFLKEKL